MEKTRKRLLSIIAAMLMLHMQIFAQAKSGVENYSQLSHGKEYTWMPILHYQSATGIYGEFRYNYEDIRTASVYFGKTFSSSGSKIDYSIIPMVGFSAGSFKGISLAVNAELEWKNLYFSSQMQYSNSWNDASQNFYFNWSETGYNISDAFYAGFAAQYTVQDAEKDFQPGLLTGLNIGNVSIPLYFFSPFSRNQFVILGLNYEFQLKRKVKNKGMYL